MNHLTNMNKTDKNEIPCQATIMTMFFVLSRMQSFTKDSLLRLRSDWSNGTAARARQEVPPIVHNFPSTHQKLYHQDHPSLSSCHKISRKRNKPKHLPAMHSPRALLRLPRHLSHRTPTRALTTTPPLLSSPFANSPAPPRLPKEEQEIFERLQKQSTGAFSTPKASEPAATSTSTSTSFSAADVRARINQSPAGNAEETRRIPEGEEVHPNLRRGAPPEFEGDVNPKTGEVGGPKVEPLRWGAGGDYSYNGRVTDF